VGLPHLSGVGHPLAAQLADELLLRDQLPPHIGVLYLAALYERLGRGVEQAVECREPVAGPVEGVALEDDGDYQDDAVGDRLVVAG
jgi:hypothetical protein